MKVTTLEHSDVRGNKLYYMVLKNSKGTEHMINVGERTVNKIKELNAEEDSPMTMAELQAAQKQKEGQK